MVLEAASQEFVGTLDALAKNKRRGISSDFGLGPALLSRHENGGFGHGID